jgi:hypothetical protein
MIESVIAAGMKAEALISFWQIGLGIDMILGLGYRYLDLLLFLHWRETGHFFLKRIRLPHLVL